MSQLSIRVETIGSVLGPTEGTGKISTPNRQESAKRGSDPLSTAQVAAQIGDPVPIVFCRRVGESGGVLISPKATEARFEALAGPNTRARYHLVLSEGELDPIEVRDVFQQSCRVGTFTQAYDRRAGDWGPGNVGVDDAPIFCGSATGTYSKLTTGSFTITLPAAVKQWDRQVHAFIRGGMHVERLLQAGSEGPSNNVADLVWWLLRRSTRVPDGLIDLDALVDAARFTSANGLNCDIEIREPSNLADWFARNLGYFLLRQARRGGRIGLRPLLPTQLDGRISLEPVSWVFTFTEDHILPGSIGIEYASRVERRPFCVQVIWRQQPDDALGLARTTEVRYLNSALDGPYEQHDISEFCTTENHAVKVGAYILSRRRHIDHRLTITVRPDTFNATLIPGDIVRVRLRRIPSVGEPQAHDYLYEVDRIGRAVNGEIQLELTHYPVDARGRSLVALDVAAARGNGALLPTGRADVSCDLNSSTDDSVTPDPGPWPDWEPEDPDPSLVPSELGIDALELLALLDIETLEDLWTWLGIETLEDLLEYFGVADLEELLTLLGFDPAEYDLTGVTTIAQLMALLGITSLSELLALLSAEQLAALLNQAFADLLESGVIDLSDIEGIEVEENGWGPGVEELETTALDPNLLGTATELETGLGVLGGSSEEEPAYTGSISFGTPVLTYPDVWYLVLAPNFARVRVDVSVDAPPLNSNLAITVNNGTEDRVVVIPRNGTKATLVMNANGSSITGNTARTMTITGAQGGGYEVLDTSATAGYTVAAYPTALAMLQPGVWVWSVDSSKWRWKGPNFTDFEWDFDTQLWTWSGSADGWTWDSANYRWSRTYTLTGWTWLAAPQRWVRTAPPGSAVDRPEGPPAGPPPLPTSIPTVPLSYTVTARVAASQVPTDRVSTLDVTLVDAEGALDPSGGVLTVPGISMYFGNWRWNPAAGYWEYPYPPSDWQWTGSAWEFIGQVAEGWQWGMEDQWTWNGSGEPLLPVPRSQPPRQNDSIHPPDGERWVWTGRRWSGTYQIEGGVAPFFDNLNVGTLTYHRRR